MSCTFPFGWLSAGSSRLKRLWEWKAAQVSHSPIKSHLFWLRAYFTHLLEVGHFRHYILIFMERTKKSPGWAFQTAETAAVRGKGPRTERKHDLLMVGCRKNNTVALSCWKLKPVITVLTHLYLWSTKVLTDKSTSKTRLDLCVQLHLLRLSWRCFAFSPEGFFSSKLAGGRAPKYSPSGTISVLMIWVVTLELF